MAESMHERIRINRGDAAALMLAGVDDDTAFDLAMRQLTIGEAAQMCAAAIIVGRDVLKTVEDPPDGADDVTPRRVLEAIVTACREVQ